MLKNILVPLDGSSVAEAAIPYAEALARRGGARLTLVRAAHASGGPLSSAEGQASAVASAELYLRVKAAELAAPGLAIETAVPYGTPAAWINEEVDLRDVDLIVMATHDRVGPERWLHGSVAEVVISHATVPVLIVRGSGGASEPFRLDGSQSVLVVPLDGSEFAEAALPVAQTFATLLGARIVLLGVVPDPIQYLPGENTVLTYTAEDPVLEQAQTRDYLTSVAERLDPSGSMETVVRVGTPAAEIAMEAQSRGAVAVVMASHGRSGLARTILGSVAGGVLHGSATPVLLIRPGRHGRSEVGASNGPVLVATALA
jgi:nucleotide-binding universal stress UspA family protein